MDAKELVAALNSLEETPYFLTNPTSFAIFHCLMTKTSLTTMMEYSTEELLTFMRDLWRSRSTPIECSELNALICGVNVVTPATSDEVMLL